LLARGEVSEKKNGGAETLRWGKLSREWSGSVLLWPLKGNVRKRGKKGIIAGRDFECLKRRKVIALDDRVCVGVGERGTAAKKTRLRRKEVGRSFVYTATTPRKGRSVKGRGLTM